MGTIIDFKVFKNRREDPNSTAFYEQEGYYWQCIEDMRLLLPAFMELAEEALRDADVDPGTFTINRTSMGDYLSSFFDPKAIGESYCGPSFDSVSQRQIMRLTTQVNVEERETLDFSCELFKIEDYQDGNREWLYYNFEMNTWESGPGEDFFDLDEILGVKKTE